MDGYRRLARTRSLAAGTAAAAGSTAVAGLAAADADDALGAAGLGDATPTSSRRRRQRALGAARIALLACTLATVVGTSVGLARSSSPADAGAKHRDEVVTVESAANRSHSAVTAATRATAKGSDTEKAPATPNAPATAKAAAVAAKPAARAAASSTSATTVPATVPARPRPSATALPFTGDPLAYRVLLAGAALILTGMLVQIAGEPLPARRRAAPAR